MASGRRILVVDDDNDLRQMMGDVLEAEGYQVAYASDGKAAMALLHAAVAEGGALPNLIVLDLMLPKMSGWDFRQALQEDERLAQVPVLVISGIGRELDAIAADAHLHKPLDLASFLRAVESLSAAEPTAPLVH